MPALPDHKSGRFYPQFFNGLSGSLARFLAKRSVELTRTEARGVRELLHGQRCMEVILRINQRILDAVGFRFEIQ
jgi:hypothetical protein